MRVVDDDAKALLHTELRWAREALTWKLDGLGEYDVRRPLASTGTNLLGLVKHAATWEARYFGEVFGRPFAGLTRWQDTDGTDLWVSSDETRADALGFYRRAQEHADSTIGELALDAPGCVPWWPRPRVTLLAVLVHVLNDTTRHAGHADILREGLDGQTGVGPGEPERIDVAARQAHCERIENAARSAAAEARPIDR